MAEQIEFKNLAKHFPYIISSTVLKSLTAEQIESVALLMESAYQNGKKEIKHG